jgi:hypothetical protein
LMQVEQKEENSQGVGKPEDMTGLLKEAACETKVGIRRRIEVEPNGVVLGAARGFGGKVERGR